MSVGAITAKTKKDNNKNANDLLFEFEEPVEVTAINGIDPNATPPPKDVPVVQGGGAGGAPPSKEVKITFPPPVIPPGGEVTINVKTKNDKAIKGKYRFTFENQFLYKGWEQFEIGSDEKPKEPD